VAESCVKHQAKLFYASTCCVYGNQEVHPVTEKTLPNPAEIYACSKLAGEQVIRGFGLMYSLPYNFMRFATIYGPGLRPALGVHIFLGQALRGEPITVHGRGEQTRTLTYIDDLIDGIIALQTSGKENESWNLTAEREISAMEMAKVAKEIASSDAPIVLVPQRPGQTFKEQISAQKMKDLTGWVAKTSFEDGMAKTFEWFKETGQIAYKYEEPK
jgi:nucleoside-diphosphate-sugar epimerase